MTIKIIYGKPGSGKSYHAVKTLASILCDWARVEKETGEPYAQRLFTNLSFNRDAVKSYVDKNAGVDFDVDRYLNILEDDFFTPPAPKRDENGAFFYDKQGEQQFDFWWDKFPDDALIVIDEIHKLLGSEFAYVKAVQETAALRNYMAQHRHKRHDWILITQDKDQIARPVLRMSEEAVHVFNLKTSTLPFPISIPMADVETLLKGFGVTRQVYRVRVGTYGSSGNRVTFDGPIQVFVMSQEIFALYQSVTMASSKLDITGDRALPFVGRWGAVRWFAMKHGPHLALKTFCAVFIFGAVYDTFLKPLGVGKRPQPTKNKSVRTVKNLENISALPQEAPIILPEEIAPETLPENNLATHSSPISQPETLPKLASAPFGVQAFFTDRIISSTGAYKIGELVEIARFGENTDDTDVIEERLERINVKRREILFEGGRIWSRKGFEPPILPPEPIVDTGLGNVDLIRDGLPLDGVFPQGAETGADRVRDVANEAN